MLPLHDALLGAIAYAVEAIVGLLGGPDRWRTRPWLVILFGLVTVSLCVTAVALVFIQALAVHAFCFLCLCSAGISLVVGALAREEVAATLRLLVAGRREGEAITRLVLDGPARRRKRSDEMSASGTQRHGASRARRSRIGAAPTSPRTCPTDREWSS